MACILLFFVYALDKLMVTGGALVLLLVLEFVLILVLFTGAMGITGITGIDGGTGMGTGRTICC